MKRILKGLLIVVTTLGSLGLQAKEYIISIEATEPTEVTLAIYDDPMLAPGQQASLTGTSHLIIPNPNTPYKLDPPLLVGGKGIVINHRKNTIDTFTPGEIQGYDKENTSGKWLLKIKEEEISFEKPKDA